MNGTGARRDAKTGGEAAVVLQYVVMSAGVGPDTICYLLSVIGIGRHPVSTSRFSHENGLHELSFYNSRAFLLWVRS